jgi:hypothetical protein
MADRRRLASRSRCPFRTPTGPFWFRPPTEGRLESFDSAAVIALLLTDKRVLRAEPNNPSGLCH